MSDEELLCRYLVPLPDVEADAAAGPPRLTYQFDNGHVDGPLVDKLLGMITGLVRPC